MKFPFPAPVLSLLLATPFLFAEEPQVRLGSTPAELSSVVLLYGRQPAGILQATGFVVDASRGWVVTAWHFWSAVEQHGVLRPDERDGKLDVAPSPYLKRYLQGDTLKPRLIWSHPSADLALIEVPALKNVHAVALNVRAPAADDRVAALGNPASRNAMWEIETGIVRGSQWKEWTYTSGQRIAAPVFEFAVELPLSTGFSGGPVFDAKGELAGMVIASAKPDGTSVYAVAAVEVQRMIGRAHAHLALVSHSASDLKSARRHANLAIGNNPADPWGYLARALMNMQQRQVADAVEDLRTAFNVAAPVRVLDLWKTSLKTLARKAGVLSPASVVRSSELSP